MTHVIEVKGASRKVPAVSIGWCSLEVLGNAELSAGLAPRQTLNAARLVDRLGNADAVPDVAMSPTSSEAGDIRGAGFSVDGRMWLP